MGSKIWIWLSAVIYIMVNPFLEINSTHLFSEYWTGHARLHNAWQLILNASLSILAIGLYKRKQEIVAIVISLVLSVSFLLAYSLSPVYKGTMLYADGTEFEIFGINPSVYTVIVIVLGLAYCLFKQLKYGTEEMT